MKHIKEKIKAIIFDLDGTIVHTEQYWQDATQDYLKSLGVITNSNTYGDFAASLSGIGLIEGAMKIKNTFKIPVSVEKIINGTQSFAIERFKQGVELVDGFEGFHKELIKLSIPNGIATNADDLSLDALKKAVNLNRYFKEHIYNRSNVENKAKPDPALFLYTAKKLNAKPEECLVFEDSLPGFKAAKAAGMRCIAIKNPKNHNILDLADVAIDNYGKAIDAISSIIR